jgi:hypothetical protein
VRLTRSALILAVLGVLLIAGAAVVRFVVLPSVSTLPEDFSSSQDYEGTYSGLNPAALAGGGADLMVEGVPVTATRSYETASVEGDTAVVTQTIERSVGGQSAPATETRYAVDRATFESTGAPTGAEDVVESEGLIFTLPLHPETDGDYALWDQATEAAYPLTFEGESELEGRTVYEYRSVAEGALASPEAQGLPTSIAKGQLVGLAPALEGVLPPELLAQLPALLAQLPDVIPVTYTSTTTSTILADAELGAPISTGSVQEITAQLAVGTTVSVPFSTVELTATGDSVAERADYADETLGQLNLVGTLLPIGLAAVGVLLLLAAIVLAVRSGRRAQPAAEDAERPVSASV